MSNEDSPSGYKHPPKRTQFKPGQSGNPSGKSKGLRSIASELRDILSEETTVTLGNETKRMTKQRALASALVTAAIEGDLKATAIVMGHLGRDTSKDGNEEEIDFSAIDQRRNGR